MIPKGIIVSCQGYSREAIEELVEHIASGGAAAIRTDKDIRCRLPLIGLKKIKVRNPEEEAYVTPTVEDVKAVAGWTKIVAVDYRRVNKNRVDVSRYARDYGLTIVADIGDIDDYKDILEQDLEHAYIATTFRVFHKPFAPDLEFVQELLDYDCNNMIAEGCVYTRRNVSELYAMGVERVCIGSAITNVYKLTKKYTSVRLKPR